MPKSQNTTVVGCDSRIVVSCDYHTAEDPRLLAYGAVANGAFGSSPSGMRTPMENRRNAAASDPTASSCGSLRDKPRFPRAHALAVALELVELLRPAAERIEIAGSVRRLKATVGDVEIVYVPRCESRPDAGDLFGSLISVNCADEVIARLERSGVLERRKNVDGRETFGALNKLMRHRASGIPVDLFATTAESWWNYLVCRTGGAESNTAIASAALRMGWEWNPYGRGFSRGGEVHAVDSEEAVFAFVGLPFVSPENRK